MTDGMIAMLALLGIIILVTVVYQWIGHLNRRNRDKRGNGS